MLFSKLKGGEWKAIINPISDEALTAKRDGYRLWLGNGSFFCEIDEFNGVQCKPAFGLIFRHYVWISAASKLKRDADTKRRSEKHFPIL